MRGLVFGMIIMIRLHMNETFKISKVNTDKLMKLGIYDHYVSEIRRQKDNILGSRLSNYERYCGVGFTSWHCLINLIKWSATLKGPEFWQPYLNK